MNVISLIGRLTFPPELRSTQSGVAVLRFQIAVDRAYTPKGQEKQADFIDCVAWRSTAEFIHRYFNKGDMIAIEGTLRSNSYVDSDGNNRKQMEVLCNNVSFCGSKKQAEDAPRPESAAKTEPAPNTAGKSDFEEIVDDDDDLPF